MISQKPKGISFDKDLDIPETKHPLKSCQWFVSVPDCEILYILATYEETKGKYLYKCSKNAKVLKEEKHICAEYFIQHTHVYFPFVISVASMNQIKIINVFDLQTMRNTSNKISKDLNVLGLYCSSFSIYVLCSDQVLRIPNLQDLKVFNSIPLTQPLHKDIMLADRNQRIYMEVLTGRERVESMIMDLSTGKRFGTLPNWSLQALSRHIEFSDKFVCALNKTTLYLHLKEQGIDYRISNVTTYCVLGNLVQKYAVGSLEGTISLFTTHFKSLTLVGICELAPYFPEKGISSFGVLHIFPLQGDYLVSVHSEFVVLWNVQTFMLIGVLELKNRPVECSVMDLNLFVFFHQPKRHVMWFNFEDTIKKQDKVNVKPDIVLTSSTYEPRRRVSSFSAKIVRRHSVELFKDMVLPESSSEEELTRSVDDLTQSMLDANITAAQFSRPTGELDRASRSTSPVRSRTPSADNSAEDPEERAERLLKADKLHNSILALAASDTDPTDSFMAALMNKPDPNNPNRKHLTSKNRRGSAQPAMTSSSGSTGQKGPLPSIAIVESDADLLKSEKQVRGRAVSTGAIPGKEGKPNNQIRKGHNDAAVKANNERQAESAGQGQLAEPKATESDGASPRLSGENPRIVEPQPTGSTSHTTSPARSPRSPRRTKDDYRDSDNPGARSPRQERRASKQAAQAGATSTTGDNQRLGSPRHERRRSGSKTGSPPETTATSADVISLAGTKPIASTSDALGSSEGKEAKSVELENEPQASKGTELNGSASKTRERGKNCDPTQRKPPPQIIFDSNTSTTDKSDDMIIAIDLGDAEDVLGFNNMDLILTTSTPTTTTGCISTPYTASNSPLVPQRPAMLTNSNAANTSPSTEALHSNRKGLNGRKKSNGSSPFLFFSNDKEKSEASEGEKGGLFSKISRRRSASTASEAGSVCSEETSHSQTSQSSHGSSKALKESKSRDKKDKK